MESLPCYSVGENLKDDSKLCEVIIISLIYVVMLLLIS